METAKQKRFCVRGRCCVPDCASQYYKDNRVKLHRFPKRGLRNVLMVNHFGKTEKIDCRRAWEIKLKTNNASDNTFVCFLHFKTDDYFHAAYPWALSRRILTKNAVPSLHLPCTNVDKPVRVKMRINRDNRVAWPTYKMENLHVDKNEPLQIRVAQKPQISEINPPKINILYSILKPKVNIVQTSEITQQSTNNPPKITKQSITIPKSPKSKILSANNCNAQSNPYKFEKYPYKAHLVNENPQNSEDKSNMKKTSCFIPNCNNISKPNSNKRFVNVPQDIKIREKWFRAIKCDMSYKLSQQNLVCCEDHFSFDLDLSRQLDSIIVRNQNIYPHIFPNNTINNESMQYIDSKLLLSKVKNKEYGGVPNKLLVPLKDKAKKVKLFNLSECCCICLESKLEYQALSNKDVDGTTFLDKINYCVYDLKPLTPRIQLFICVACSFTLRNAYNFRQSCLMKQQYLSPYLEENGEEQVIKLTQQPDPPDKSLVNKTNSPKHSCSEILKQYLTQNTPIINSNKTLNKSGLTHNKTNLQPTSHVSILNPDLTQNLTIDSNLGSIISNNKRDKINTILNIPSKLNSLNKSGKSQNRIKNIITTSNLPNSKQNLSNPSKSSSNLIAANNSLMNCVPDNDLLVPVSYKPHQLTDLPKLKKRTLTKKRKTHFDELRKKYLNHKRSKANQNFDKIFTKQSKTDSNACAEPHIRLVNPMDIIERFGAIDAVISSKIDQNHIKLVDTMDIINQIDIQTQDLLDNPPIFKQEPIELMEFYINEASAVSLASCQLIEENTPQTNVDNVKDHNKPLKCSVCNKTFGIQSHLKLHLLNHNKKNQL